ncbi:MAG: hypothetical protein J6S04_01630, partial [Clostridia bacterium]|nr:hypothetical protein [Clostridia bacterium]
MEEKKPIAQSNEGKLFNFRLVLFAAIYLAIGIGFCFYYRFYSLSPIWLLCLLPASVFPAFLSYSLSKWKEMGWAAVLLCICFLTGFFGFGMQVDRYEKVSGFGECNFSGRVVEVEEGYNGVEVVLDDVKVEGERQNCKLIAYLPASFEGKLTLSDELFLYGEVTKKDITSENFVPYAKDFGKRIFLVANNADGEKTGHRFDLFLFLNAHAKKVIAEGMDPTPAAVTRAVLLGDSS